MKAILTAAVIASLLAVRGQTPPQTGAPPPTLIRNARLIDGSGAPARMADVRIAGDRIVAVGQLGPVAGERVYDAGGLALAPGFIDTHSHHDRGLESARDAVPMVSQGVTTIVVGQDGGGIDLAALFARLEREPAAVNVGSYAGHGAIRGRVMGKDFARAATAAELRRMEALLATEMDAGALGLSTGLEYDPGIYSTPEEVLGLAKVAAAAGGRYASHIRSEDRDFWDAIDELIAIGRQHRMPVHVSHVKLGMHDLWGQAAKLIGVLDRARGEGVQLTADLYPYTYWQSNLGVLYPKRNFADRGETEFVLAHVALAGDILFNSFRAHPDYAGKTLAQVAALRGTPAARTLMDLLAEPGGASAGIVAKGMSDGDVERLIQWPFVNVCSDGQSRGLHPRGFGAFARVLGPWVRDKRLFPIEEAVRKMSSLSAANAGIVQRGLIAPDYFADLVVFDPSTVADRADFGHAQDLAVGVRTVWVNGQIVFDNGKTTTEYPGRPLRRSAGTMERTAAPTAAPQEIVDGFVARTFKAANGDTMPYRLFVPDATARSKPLPLILYLHGSGGVGRDNLKQISGGNTAGTHTWTTPEAQRKHPAFVLAPQLADAGRSPRLDAWPAAAGAVLEIVAAVSREFGIDADRVYVTGQSLGGYGTWNLVTKHADVFAAAVPLCGGGDPSRVGAARTLPIWAFHGARDSVVPVTESRELVAALRRGGSPVKYTEYPDVQHDVWTRAYAEPDLSDWLFTQRRRR